jgi:hypothetical protein
MSQEVLLRCVLWDQPARIVDRHAAGKAGGDAQIRYIKLRRWATLDEAPRVGDVIHLPEWDCGTIDAIGWDERHNALAVTVAPIFVEDGPADQRDSDFWVLRNAAVVSGWQDSEPATLAVMRAPAAQTAARDQRRGLFGFGKALRGAAA